MCGVVGFTGSEDSAALRKMAGEIVHRGPDDDGFYESPLISLGMRRLSIVDLATGKQPVHNEDRRIWSIFNGEIYNFPELRAGLEAAGHTFYTHHSDTELIVHLYEEYGLEFPHKINGMFAIVLWDSGREELFLIRDRMGVKPLFYSRTAGDIVFASEIKSILAHPAIIKEPCLEALYHYFSLKNVPAPLTAFKGIFSLRPGQILRYSNGEVLISSWWAPRFKEDESADESECAVKILSLLEDATRIRMRCDVPFGAYLSGGVDSSTVVSLMSRFSSQPVKTFSLGYEDELKNKAADIYFARKVSKMFGTEHNEYIMSARELEEDIEAVIGAFDQPFSGTISTFFLSKLICRHVKVALSGDGADELFGSYLSHRTAAPMGHFIRLLDKVGDGSLTEEEKRLFLPCSMDFLQDLYRKSGGREEEWRYALYLFSDREKHEMLSPFFISNLSGLTTLALSKEYLSGLTAKHPLNRILEMEWKTQLPDNVLAFVDFLSMAHSVEVRSPFLDYRLVEFCNGIPGDFKIKNGVVKHVLKLAVKSILPEGIVDRPKEGFVLPIFDWMTARLERYCEAVMDAGRLAGSGFLNEQRIRSIWLKYRDGDRSQAGKVWNVMMFQLWWEKYFGKSK
jgi:asparagine synthase (glutamine-hydrolysing)